MGGVRVVRHKRGWAWFCRCRGKWKCTWAVSQKANKCVYCGGGAWPRDWLHPPRDHHSGSEPRKLPRYSGRENSTQCEASCIHVVINNLKLVYNPVFYEQIYKDYGEAGVNVYLCGCQSEWPLSFFCVKWVWWCLQYHLKNKQMPEKPTCWFSLFAVII